MNLIERLNQIAEHDWRTSLLGHASDTAVEAVARITELEAEIARLSDKVRPFSDAFAQQVIDRQVKEIDRLVQSRAAVLEERDKWKAAAEAHFTRSVL